MRETECYYPWPPPDGAGGWLKPSFYYPGGWKKQDLDRGQPKPHGYWPTGGGKSFGPFRPLFWPTIPWGDGKIIA